jgi:hypothetical protein
MANPYPDNGLKNSLIDKNTNTTPGSNNLQMREQVVSENHPTTVPTSHISKLSSSSMEKETLVIFTYTFRGTSCAQMITVVMLLMIT